jgi:hypothetical protein
MPTEAVLLVVGVLAIAGVFAATLAFYSVSAGEKRS